MVSWSTTAPAYTRLHTHGATAHGPNSAGCLYQTGLRKANQAHDAQSEGYFNRDCFRRLHSAGIEEARLVTRNVNLMLKP